MAFAISIVGCSSDNDPVEDVMQGSDNKEAGVETRFLLTDAEKGAAAATQGFGYDFFRAVSGCLPADENVVVSPLSAQLLLSMTANATDAAATAEIASALGCNDLDALNSLAEKCLTKLPAVEATTKLALANSVWYADSHRLNPVFARSMTDFYAADNFARDFTLGQPLVDEINGWCADKTNGLVPKILSNIPEGTEAIMANAMYFKGQWANPFEDKETIDKTFHGSAISSIVKMMHNEGMQHYAEGNGYEAVKMEMGNGAFAVTFVLPDAGKSIGDFINGFDYAGLASIEYRDITIDLSLPLCKLTSDDIDLEQALRSLGVNAIFNGGDFSLFTEKIAAKIKVNQKSAVEFNEQGAEGASVTWNYMVTSNLDGGKVEIPVVTFNRPFLFFVNETSTGICLMAGKFMNL